MAKGDEVQLLLDSLKCGTSAIELGKAPDPIDLQNSMGEKRSRRWNAPQPPEEQLLTSQRIIEHVPPSSWV